MKKLLIIAAAALLAAACAKTYEVKETTPPAIGFGTWANTMTKAEARVPATNDFLAGDTFNVYGYKTIGEDKTTVFNGDVVEKQSDGSWTYSPVRFWDSNASSYTFNAVSPSGMINSATVNTGVMTSKSIEFSGKNNDVLVATQKTVSSANFSDPSVALDFHHVASLVDLKIRKAHALENATVAVTAISLINVDATGTFAVAAGAAPTVTWTPTARATYTHASGYESVTLPSDVVDMNTTPAGDFLIHSLIAMPQTFRVSPAENIQTVKITYKITQPDTGEVSTFTDVTFDLKAFDDSDYPDGENNADQNDGTLISGWNQGVHYTYYITIDANKITFTASISDWSTDSATGYHYLLN